MSENDTSAVGETRESESESIAVGVIATHSNSDAVARTILRATERGHDVFVGHYGDRAVEAVDFADRLGATVVDPGDQDIDQETLKRELAATARACSCTGIIFQSEKGERINYRRSEAVLDDGAFGVDAVPADGVGKHTDPYVVVGIPAYNEEDTIAEVVRGASPYAAEVLVVDDGSHDRTVQMARESGATVLEHGRNRGYGAALKTLVSEARRRHADHLIVLDADGQHEPEDIPRLLEEQRESGSEIVIGSRFVDGVETDAPVWRRVGLSVVNVLTNLSLGIVRSSSRIRDTQSGFRAYDREAIESLADDETISNNMSASTDILYHAHARDYRIEEVGTKVYYDGDSGSTHHPIAHGATLVQNIVKTIESRRPMTVLGVPGLLATLVGVGFAYWTIINYLQTGTFPYGLAIVSTFFALSGILSSFTAIILHSLNRRLEDG